MNVKGHLWDEAKKPLSTNSAISTSYVASTQSFNYSLRLISANSKDNVLGILNTHKEQTENPNL